MSSGFPDLLPSKTTETTQYGGWLLILLPRRAECFLRHISAVDPTAVTTPLGGCSRRLSDYGGLSWTSMSSPVQRCQLLPTSQESYRLVPQRLLTPRTLDPPSALAQGLAGGSNVSRYLVHLVQPRPRPMDEVRFDTRYRSGMFHLAAQDALLGIPYGKREGGQGPRSPRDLGLLDSRFYGPALAASRPGPAPRETWGLVPFLEGLDRLLVQGIGSPRAQTIIGSPADLGPADPQGC